MTAHPNEENMEKTNITLTLPVEAVNTILGVLGTRPFNEIAPLWSEIKRQADGQLQPAPAPTE